MNWDLRLPAWPLAGDLDRRVVDRVLAERNGETAIWTDARWDDAHDGPDVAESELRARADLVGRWFAARSVEDAGTWRRLDLAELSGPDAMALLDVWWSWTIRRLQYIRDTGVGEALGLGPPDLAELDELAETEYYVRRARLERGEPVRATLELRLAEPVRRG